MNKKGFTLIEIIVCIAIISILAVSSIALLIGNSSKKEEELKREYVDRIKMETSLYIEISDNTKLSELNDPNDFTYIQLKDLIDNGLLKAEDYNPFNGNSSRESEEDFVKIYLDNNRMINIIYPVSYEEIDSTLKAIIKLEDNYDEANQVLIPGYQDVLVRMNQEIDSENYSNSISFFKAIQSGEIYKYDNENKYKLVDYYGVEIDTEPSDWCITETWDSESKLWNYEYSICDDSSIRNVYDEISNAYRTVFLIDNESPVLLIKDSNIEYNINNGDYFVVLYDNLNYNINFSHNNRYYILDNYDGPSYNVTEKIEWLIPSNNLIGESDFYLYDSNGNEGYYLIKFKQYDGNSAPNIGYYGKSNVCIDDVYYSEGKFYPFNDNIYLYDADDNLSYVEYKFCLNDYCRPSYDYYEFVCDENDVCEKKYSLSPGEYRLDIYACDVLGECSYDFHDIYIDSYCYTEDAEEDDGIDDSISDPWCEFGGACAHPYDEYWHQYYYDSNYNGVPDYEEYEEEECIVDGTAGGVC